VQSHVLTIAHYFRLHLPHAARHCGDRFPDRFVDDEAERARLLRAAARVAQRKDCG
jgi:hypothetical protein